MSRFVVTTIEGWQIRGDRIERTSANPGMSAHVVDTLWNRRVCGTFRTEDWRGRHAANARTKAVERARELADRLNAAHEREVTQATSGMAR